MLNAYLFKNWLKKRYDNGDTSDITEREWRDNVATALCAIWYDPSFLPPEQTRGEILRLGFGGKVDGSDWKQCTIRVYNKLLDCSKLPYEIERRKSALLASLSTPSSQIVGSEAPRGVESKQDAGDDGAEEEELSAAEQEEEAEMRFQSSVGVDDYVAISVDESEADWGFLIGKVVSMVSDDSIRVVWWKPRRGVSERGKWSQEYEAFGVLSKDVIPLSTVLPVNVEWRPGGSITLGYYLEGGCLRRLRDAEEERQARFLEQAEWAENTDSEDDDLPLDQVAKKHKTRNGLYT